MGNTQSKVKRIFCPKFELWIKSLIRLDFIKRVLAKESRFNSHTCQNLSDMWHMCIMEAKVFTLLHKLGIPIPCELRVLLEELNLVLLTLSKSIVYHQHVPMINFIELEQSVKSKWSDWLEFLGNNVDGKALMDLDLELFNLRFGTYSDDRMAKYLHFIELLPERQSHSGTEPEISIREAKRDQVLNQPPPERLVPETTIGSSTQLTSEYVQLTINDIEKHKDSAIKRINLHCEEKFREYSSFVSDLFSSGILVNSRVQPCTFNYIYRWLNEILRKTKENTSGCIGLATKAADDTIAVLRDAERLLNENPSSQIMRGETVSCFDRKMQRIFQDMQERDARQPHLAFL